MNFKNLYTEEKYKTIIEFCTKHKRLPIYNSPRKYERVMSRFITNKKNTHNRSKRGLARGLAKWEVKKLEQIEHFKESTIDKLNDVLKFCKMHSRPPRYLGNKEKGKKEEREVAKKLNSLKTREKEKENPFTPQEKKIFDKIALFKTKHQQPRMEKMQNVLAFCETHKRTPKQHVGDINEKRLAEFLSSIKTLVKNKKLSKKEREIFEKILKYSPDTSQKNLKEQNLKKLLTFVTNEKSLPKNKEKTPEDEKILSSFYTKVKGLARRKKLTDGEVKILDKINEICNVKTRLQKIEDLYTFVKINKRVPSIKSCNENEIKKAVFFSNIKNTQKKKGLKKDEDELLMKIIDFKKEKILA